MVPFQRRIRQGVIAVVAHPVLTLIIAGIFLAVSILLAFTKLSVSSDEGKLFSTGDRHFRESYEFNEKFPENDAMYIVIESKEPKAAPPLRRWTDLADRLTAKLKQMPREVASAECRVPLDQLGVYALLFATPADMKGSVEDLRGFAAIIRIWGETLPEPRLWATRFERFADWVGTVKSVPGIGKLFSLDRLAPLTAALADSWMAALANRQMPLQPGHGLPDFIALGADDPSGLGYFYQPEENDPARKMLLIRVSPKVNYNSLTAISETVESIRGAIRDIAKDYPEFVVGTTGRPALSADEMRTTDNDSNKAEIVAMCVIFVLLYAMLRSLWIALAAELALATAIGWTFGWTTLAVGELNLLSLVFLIALIGIGMDYLVQILMAYRREARRRVRPAAVWARVFRSVGPPINTACLGAAGAFVASIFTDFRGAADLGIIAGGGLLLCLVAGYTVLPALLVLFPPKLKMIKSTRRYSGRPATVGGWRLIFPLAWIACLLLGIGPAMRTKFNSNLLDMQAPKIPSVKLVRKLQTWFGVVLSKDLDVLRKARQAVEVSPLVERTESILQAFDNYQWLQTQAATLPKINWADPERVRPENLASITEKLQSLAAFFNPATTPAMQPTANVAASLRAAAAAISSLYDNQGSAEHIAKRLSDWQVAFVAQLKGLMQQLSPPPLDPRTLPIELRGHYLSDDGTYALYIYPKGDLWKQNNLERFVKDVEARAGSVPGSPVVTGIAVSVYHSTGLIQRSFYRATFYALGLIVILVLIDLRHIGQTLLAISVLALGLPLLVALMGLFHIDWNLANFFGLPILIGAGHEYGVFLVHRYREALQDPRRAWRVWDASDRALLLCGLVTCSSFGFFWAMGSHRGLRSLGLVMAMGTACIYLAAVVVLRPFLLWLLRRARRRANLVPSPGLPAGGEKRS